MRLSTMTVVVGKCSLYRGAVGSGRFRKQLCPFCYIKVILSHPLIHVVVDNGDDSSCVENGDHVFYK